MLVSERGVLAGCSNQIRTVVFAKLYSFFPSICLSWFSYFWKQNFWVTFSGQDRLWVDYVLELFRIIISGNVQLAILHISLVKKMNKTMKSNDQNDQISSILGIFGQI